MAIEIIHQNQLEEDYLVDVRNLKLEPSESQSYLYTYNSQAEALEPFEINSIAHRRVGSYLEVPADYYNRMRTDYLGFLVKSVDSWLNREPAKCMLRTIGGTARTFLSNRYRRIDSMEIVKAVFPIIGQMEGVHSKSCQAIESRMYMKIVNIYLEAEVVPDGIIQAGLAISNDEAGQGSANTQSLVCRLVCRNGMIVNDARARQCYTGQINTLGENFQLYLEETLTAEDHAFVKKIEDIVKAAVEEVRFPQIIDITRNVTTARMNTVDVPETV